MEKKNWINKIVSFFSRDSEESIQDYCPKCGTCGFIECCGVREFLVKHVRGKTGCPNEGLILNEIIQACNEYTGKEENFVEKCKTCGKYNCSGWHKVYASQDTETSAKKKITKGSKSKLLESK